MIFLTENNNVDSNLDLNDILLENYELLLEAETTYNALEKELLIEEHTYIINETILNEKVGLLRRFWEGVKTFFSKLWRIVKNITRVIVSLLKVPFRIAKLFLTKSYEGKEVTQLTEYAYTDIIENTAHAKEIEKLINDENSLGDETYIESTIANFKKALEDFKNRVEEIKKIDEVSKVYAAKTSLKNIQAALKISNEYSELVEKFIERKIKMYESDKENSYTTHIASLKKIASYWTQYLTTVSKNSIFFINQFNTALKNAD